MTKNEWIRNMRDFARQHQDSRRRLHPRELSPQQYEQYRILGGTLISWLQKHGSALIDEREILRRSKNWDGTPHTVIISDLPGLVAALRIVPLKDKTRSSLTEEEYAQFLLTNPDPEYKWHVVFRNSFRALDDPELLARASRQYPISGDEQYWIHKEESIMGRLFTRTGLHLWRWDGDKYHLLEEAFVHYIS